MTRRNALTRAGAPTLTRNTVPMGIFSDGRLAAWAKRQQGRRARQERRLADNAIEQDEAHAHERRADKATYLQEKLQERERSERAAE